MLLAISLAASGNDKIALFGLVLAAVVAVLGGISWVVCQWWRITEPGRTYAISFVPPTTDRERKTCRATRNDEKIIELYVKVRAKKPVITSTHLFRLVDRQLSIRANRVWDFKSVSADQVSVCRLWDAEWERQKKEAGDPLLAPPQQAALRRDGVDTWAANYGLRETAVEAAFLYRVIIKMHSTDIWRGFLQFTATGKDGRISQTQRGLTLWP